MRNRILLLATLVVLALLPAGAADVRADFLKLIDRPRVPLAPQIESLSPTR